MIPMLSVHSPEEGERDSRMIYVLVSSLTISSMLVQEGLELGMTVLEQVSDPILGLRKLRNEEIELESDHFVVLGLVRNTKEDNLPKDNDIELFESKQCVQYLVRDSIIPTVPVFPGFPDLEWQSCPSDLGK